MVGCECLHVATFAAALTFANWQESTAELAVLDKATIIVSGDDIMLAAEIHDPRHCIALLDGLERIFL